MKFWDTKSLALRKGAAAMVAVALACTVNPALSMAADSAAVEGGVHS